MLHRSINWFLKNLRTTEMHFVFGQVHLLKMSDKVIISIYKIETIRVFAIIVEVVVSSSSSS